MPLFVPILRLVMLFLNIYDSYKTLKYPPPSSRNGGRPSLRAVSQRKRDLKGCLAVWIVWCCFCIYERFIEGLISLFIPFYDEIKSLVLLFLILTRARGAEPIYLHIIRPFLKPYTPAIDSSLELTRHIGDFFYALSLYPIQLAWDKYRTTFGNPQEPPIYGSEDSESSAGDDGGRVQFPRQSIYLASENQASSRTLAPNGRQEHKIWHPPASAYDDDDASSIRSNGIDGLPESEITVVHAEVEEWRKYPAFPSAYPPTPVITTSRLVASSLKSSSSGGRTMYPSIAEEEPPQQSQQGFHQSLLPPRKPLNPSYVGDLSDELTKRGGIQSSSASASVSGRSSPSSLGDKPGGKPRAEEVHADLGLEEEIDPTADEGMSDNSEDYTDEDEFDEEEEDQFNITLRTPLPPHGSFRSRPAMPPMSFSAPAAAFALERLASVASTALTTASEASVESSLSDTDEPDDVVGSTVTQKGKARATRSAVLPSKPVGILGANGVGNSGRHKTPTRRRKISTTSRKPVPAGTSNAEGEADGSSPSEQQKPSKLPTGRRLTVPTSPRQRVISTGNGGARVRPRVTRPASPPPKGRIGTVEKSGRSAGNEAVNIQDLKDALLETGNNEAAPANKNEAASISATSTTRGIPRASTRKSAPVVSKKPSGSSDATKSGPGASRPKTTRKDTVRPAKPSTTTTK